MHLPECCLEVVLQSMNNRWDAGEEDAIIFLDDNKVKDLMDLTSGQVYAKEADASANHQELVMQYRPELPFCAENESFPQAVALNAGWHSAELTPVIHMYFPCIFVPFFSVSKSLCHLHLTKIIAGIMQDILVQALWQADSAVSSLEPHIMHWHCTSHLNAIFLPPFSRTLPSSDMKVK